MIIKTQKGLIQHKVSSGQCISYNVGIMHRQHVDVVCLLTNSFLLIFVLCSKLFSKCRGQHEMGSEIAE